MAPGCLFVKLLEAQHEVASKVLICCPQGLGVDRAAADLYEALCAASSGSWWQPEVVELHIDCTSTQATTTLMVITPEKGAANSLKYELSLSVAATFS